MEYSEIQCATHRHITQRLLIHKPFTLQVFADFCSTKPIQKPFWTTTHKFLQRRSANPVHSKNNHRKQGQLPESFFVRVTKRQLTINSKSLVQFQGNSMFSVTAPLELNSQPLAPITNNWGNLTAKQWCTLLKSSVALWSKHNYPLSWYHLAEKKLGEQGKNTFHGTVFWISHRPVARGWGGCDASPPQICQNVHFLPQGGLDGVLWGG